MGVPSGFEMALTTKPYYRSTYALVYRKDAGYTLRSLDDPKLRELRIGLHFIGDDYSNPPPAEALSRCETSWTGFSQGDEMRSSLLKAHGVSLVKKDKGGPHSVGFFTTSQPITSIPPIYGSKTSGILIRPFSS